MKSSWLHCGVCIYSISLLAIGKGMSAWVSSSNRMTSDCNVMHCNCCLAWIFICCALYYNVASLYCPHALQMFAWLYFYASTCEPGQPKYLCICICTPAVKAVWNSFVASGQCNNLDLEHYFALLYCLIWLCTVTSTNFVLLSTCMCTIERPLHFINYVTSAYHTSGKYAECKVWQLTFLVCLV
jgi:hypothetical protein